MKKGTMVMKKSRKRRSCEDSFNSPQQQKMDLADLQLPENLSWSYMNNGFIMVCIHVVFLDVHGDGQTPPPLTQGGGR